MRESVLPRLVGLLLSPTLFWLFDIDRWQTCCSQSLIQSGNILRPDRLPASHEQLHICLQLGNGGGDLRSGRSVHVLNDREECSQLSRGALSSQFGGGIGPPAFRPDQRV